MCLRHSPRVGSRFGGGWIKWIKGPASVHIALRYSAGYSIPSSHSRQYLRTIPRGTAGQCHSFGRVLQLVLGTYRGACRSTTRDGRAKTPTSAARAAAVCSALCSRAAASRAARARATVVARCCVLYATRRMSHVASSAERAGRAEAGERGKCASPVCHLAPQYPEYPGA